MNSNDLKETYILNPDYFLRQDNTRIILASKSESDSTYCEFMHPVYAIMFSFFKGDKPLEEVIRELGVFFSMDDDAILKVIIPFIENKKHMNFVYDGVEFWMPERIIVKNSNNKIRSDLASEQFVLKGPYDFKSMRLNIPTQMLLIINTQCVTDCIYCYADKCTKYIPMATQKVLSLLDEARAIGIESFDISGGEIFIHKDWEIILRKVCDNGYKPSISTKVPLSKEDIDNLYDIGIKDIQISLDAIDPVLLRNTLHVPLNYANNIKNTILYLDEKGFAITIKSTFTRHTCMQENLSQIIDFLKRLKNIKQYTYTAVGYSHYKSVEAFNNFKPVMDQVVEMKEFFENLGPVNFRLRADDGSVTDGSECCNASMFSKLAYCTGNLRSLVVLPDGKVTICEELYWDENFIIGDLTKNSILEVWQSDKAVGLWRLDQTDMPEDSVCTSCEEFAACRHGRGVCWKELIAAYGKENWLYPDHRGPRAPKPFYPIFYDNSFLFVEY